MSKEYEISRDNVPSEEFFTGISNWLKYNTDAGTT
jgi:hypothetical protein